MWKKFLVVALVLIPLGYLGVRYMHDDANEPVFGNIGAHLTPEEVSSHEKAARQGNLESAARLARYYGFARRDDAKQKEWLIFAAERGHTQSQYNLGLLYEALPEREGLDRAKYWLTKAAQAGDRDAQQVLSRLTAK